MNSSVANLSLRRVVATPESQLLKMRERKDPARCLHFVLPLAEWGLALNVLIKTRESATLVSSDSYKIQYIS